MIANLAFRIMRAARRRIARQHVEDLNRLVTRLQEERYRHIAISEDIGSALLEIRAELRKARMHLAEIEDPQQMLDEALPTGRTR